MIGSGGREHALVTALARDPQVTEVHAAPGNPGIAATAAVHLVDAMDGEAIADLAAEVGADLVIVGPEAPLVAGVADVVRAAGVACFGPSRAAAAIEGSKAFAKDVMYAAGIPTGLARLCATPAQVSAALDEFGAPYVVKDDALAAGKGVVVTTDRGTAKAHANACARVVVEEFLDGPEVSLFAICDGETVLPMQPAQDFKRLRVGDAGPNTGGMGAYTPLPWAPHGLAADACSRVLQPAVDELARRGKPFVGLLYAGLALTARGVKVVEFNARFGDPETQVLLPVLDTPLGQLLAAAATGRLGQVGELRWRPAVSVAVVMAAAGYPESPRKGDAISGVADAQAMDGVQVLHAGTALAPARPAADEAGLGPASGSQLVTAGGRVLTVTATGPSVQRARDLAYAGVNRIHFDGAQYRSDIALATRSHCG